MASESGVSWAGGGSLQEASVKGRHLVSAGLSCVTLRRLVAPSFLILLFPGVFSLFGVQCLYCLEKVRLRELMLATSGGH